VVDQGGDVVGHGPDVERPVDIRGPPMPLQVWNDDAVVRREHPDRWAEHLA